MLPLSPTTAGVWRELTSETRSRTCCICERRACDLMLAMRSSILHTLCTRPIAIKSFARISAGGISLLAAMSTSNNSSSSPSKDTSSSNGGDGNEKQRWNPQPYTPRHNKWPYTAKDFERSDPGSDESFYGSPRFVTHIDDAAISSLTEYYDAVLPRKGRILDFCSSWTSHYPASIQEAAKASSSRRDESGDNDPNAAEKLEIVGMGMSDAELRANKVLNRGSILRDLNDKPTIPEAVTRGEPGLDSKNEVLLDASTCVVSIDYLIHPVQVLSSLRERTKKGGTVHLVISNRCFPTKAVARWLRVGEGERLLMVGDYLWFAGWRNIEILDLKDEGGDSRNEGEEDFGGQGVVGQLQRLMRGFGGNDPLWVVRGVKVEA